MLQKLSISNYTLITKADLDFNKGFTVITGETEQVNLSFLELLNFCLAQEHLIKYLKTLIKNV